MPKKPTTASAAVMPERQKIAELPPRIEKPHYSVPQHKMWLWVQNLWATCPTDMDLHPFYQKFREELHQMYTAQAVD